MSPPTHDRPASVFLDSMNFAAFHSLLPRRCIASESDRKISNFFEADPGIMKKRPLNIFGTKLEPVQS